MHLPLSVVLALSALASLPAPSSGQVADAAPPPVVAVASRRLPRGTVLEAGDIALAAVVSRGVGDTASRGVAPGWVTRRLVRAGEPLRPPAVTPPPLVAAGAPVRFVVQRASLEVAVDGIAVVAASLGDTIPVRLGAKRRVLGVVTGRVTVVALDSLRSP